MLKNCQTGKGDWGRMNIRLHEGFKRTSPIEGEVNSAVGKTKRSGEASSSQDEKSGKKVFSIKAQGRSVGKEKDQKETSKERGQGELAERKAVGHITGYSKKKLLNIRSTLGRKGEPLEADAENPEN